MDAWCFSQFLRRKHDERKIRVPIDRNNQSGNLVISNKLENYLSENIFFSFIFRNFKHVPRGASDPSIVRCSSLIFVDLTLSFFISYPSSLLTCISISPCFTLLFLFLLLHSTTNGNGHAHESLDPLHYLTF